MTPQFWDRVSRAFTRASAQADRERDAFLAQLRQEDAAVADEVESLLRQREIDPELRSLPSELWQCIADSPKEPEGIAPPATPGDALAVEDTTQHYDRPATAGALPPAEYAFLSPPQLADEIGRLGCYRVLGVLGQGGMGIVFKAEDSQLNRPVALKVIKPAYLDENGRQRFLREARAMAAVKHDHIVTLYQVTQEGPVSFLAMEFLQGETLEHWPQRGDQATVSQILRVGREIASGLAAAHAAGLIHRDIKPANIWLEAPKGRVKILDFGLARAGADNSRLTRLGAVVGTPAYMAPEQAQGKPVDFRCDLFSLGCVLYRLCTGCAPFRENTVQETLIAVATRDPMPPHQVNPQIPKGLSDLVMKLLAKKPEDRPLSAQAVVDGLKVLQAERTAVVAGRKSGPLPVVKGQPAPERAAAPKRTLPSSWSLWWIGAGGIAAAGGALVIVAALVVAFWLRRDPPPIEPVPGDEDKSRADNPVKVPPVKQILTFDGNTKVEVKSLRLPRSAPVTLEG
ncbi:MAG: serine/threonine protein kinase [Planctomycetes bacterium]|nr:serine/threonine protein kinase [Planctomycetota bacterium]